MPRSARFEDVRTVTADKAREYQDGSIPVHGEGKRGSQCYTVDGLAFWSYSTCIAVVDTHMQYIIINRTKYSATTNRFVSMLQHELTARYPGYEVVQVTPNGFNVTADQLEYAAAMNVKDLEMGDPVNDLIDVEDRQTARNFYGQPLYRMRNRSTLI